jgi:hypothetical protein
MNEWSKRTLELVTKENYLDRLQLVYSHEEGERDVSEAVLDAIRKAFEKRDEEELLNQLLGLEKFPYKDSYVGFLRKDRSALQRNPETVQRICNRLYNMGIENVIQGITQSKEANTRRGPQFTNWIKKNFKVAGLEEFRRSASGIVVLGSSELEARDFCNKEFGIGISKRPDIVAKSGKKYVVGEAKFLSSTGGNQGRAFDDGIHLATNTSGSAYKIFVLDGVHWIEKGSEQHKRIEYSNAAIFSILLLKQFLEELE